MHLKFALTILAVTVGLAATDAHAETLTEALTQTYETNPDLAASRAQLRATDEEVPQALSNWRPEVEVNGSYGVRVRDRDLATGPDIENTDQPQSLSLEVTQNLFRGFRTIADSARARNTVAAGRADLIETEQNVLLEAVTAYMNLVRDRAILGLRENNVRVLEQQQQATRDRFDVGELTRTDVAQSDSRLASAISDRTTAQGNVNTSVANYVEAIGIIPGELARPNLPSGLPASENEAIEEARRNNPAVVEADFSERAARDSIELVEGELLPVLQLSGELEENEDILGSDTQTSEQSITLNMTVPLYQAGNVFSRIRAAKHTANRNLLQLAEIERRAVEDAQQGWSDLQSAAARIVSLEAEVRAQEIAFEGVQQEAQVGSRTVLDVLDAEQELLNARVGLVQAERDHIVAAYTLLSAVGRLTAQDLQLPVELYDPTRNFDAVEGKIFGGDVLE